MSAEQPLRWEEELLVASARGTSWPATPELRARVLARIEAPSMPGAPTPTLPRNRGGSFGVLPRGAVFAAVALLLAAVLVVLSVPRTRTAVAEFFGLVEGYRIERVAATPTVAAGLASSTPTATPTPTLLRDVAQRVTLEEAAARVGFEPAQPSVAVGAESEVYVLDAGFTMMLPATVLRYSTFDLWEGRVGGKYFIGKGVPEGEVIETTTVKGAPAYWIGGFPRTVRFVDSEGREVAGTARTVTVNALVWTSVSGRHFRIETELPLAEALRIAESLP